MSGSPTSTMPAPDPAGSKHLPCLFSFPGELPNAEICPRPLNGKTINHVINIEGDMATIGVGRSRAQQLERRRQRIELVHELAAAKKKISEAEIARRVAVSPSTVYRDLRREAPPTPRARRDLVAQHRVEQREQRVAQVRALDDQGRSQTAIANRLGVSRWAVRSDLSDRPRKPWRRPDLTGT
jgi:transposase